MHTDNNKNSESIELYKMKSKSCSPPYTSPIPKSNLFAIYVLKSCPSVTCFISLKWYLPFRKAKEFKSRNLPLFPVLLFPILTYYIFFIASVGYLYSFKSHI